MGAHLRISDVETCNTKCFLWVYCMLEQAVSPNIQQFGGVIYFVLGKRSPRYLPEDFTEMAFVGKTRKLGNPLHCIIRMFRHLLCGVFYQVYCSPNV